MIHRYSEFRVVSLTDMIDHTDDIELTRMAIAKETSLNIFSLKMETL